MDSIEIIDYTPDLQPEFERINKQWVEQFFSLEEFDRNQLEHPQEYIIDKGGAILFARDGGQILGTVGLGKSGEDVYEMIKMGVSPEARGKGVGNCWERPFWRKQEPWAEGKSFFIRVQNWKQHSRCIEKLVSRTFPWGAANMDVAM
jgi:GNAT superfamily N-acetyltransferase